ncbi:MAG: hypothetical protein JXR84_08440 [Anaerolineae bacterium]|nr:hypothetical protein [Anaerolineae bacterium]
MSLHNDVGAFGEALTRETLAQIAPVQDGQAADLRFCDVEIEVKTARPSLYNGQTRGYQFLLKKRDRYGATNFRKADVLVLICLNDDLDPIATYVLPTSRLKDRKKITIPASLKTPFDVFRDRWEIIADEYVRRWGNV